MHDDLVISCSYTGLTGAVTGAHIHQAPAGVNGPIVFPFSNPNSPINETWSDLMATDAQNLEAGNLYVQIHSTVYPGGEIRGQIMPEACPEPEPEAVPTMNHWGLIVFGILLAGSAVWFIRKY